MSEPARPLGLAPGKSYRAYYQITSAAACVGVSAKIMLSSKPAHQLIALTYCAVCPVKAGCLELVDPVRNHFDGAAGGRVFTSGQDVTDMLKIKGWLSTRYKHSQVSHNRIKQVLTEQLSLEMLSATDKMVFAYAAMAHGRTARQIAKWLEITETVVYAYIAMVETDAPYDTRWRAEQWPMTFGRTHRSRRRLLGAAGPAGLRGHAQKPASVR